MSANLWIGTADWTKKHEVLAVMFNMTSFITVYVECLVNSCKITKNFDIPGLSFICLDAGATYWRILDISILWRLKRYLVACYGAEHSATGGCLICWVLKYHKVLTELIWLLAFKFINPLNTIPQMPNPTTLRDVWKTEAAYENSGGSQAGYNSV